MHPMIHWPSFSPDDPRVLKYLKAFFALHLAIMMMMLMTWYLGQVGLFGNRDFIPFWVASRLMHEGHPEFAYDYHVLEMARQVYPRSLILFGWINPPTTLLLYWPLGLFSCDLAWLLFVIGTTGFLLIVIRKIVNTPLASWATLASPALAFNTWNGQNGALNAALLGLALLSVEKKPLRAGFSGALLACKPHLAAVLCLVEFIRYRKALLFTVAILLAFIGLTLLLMGFSLWHIWWQALPLNDFAAQHGGTLRVYDRMASVFSVGRYNGLDVVQSWVLHAIVALSAIGIVITLWRNQSVDFDIKAASVPLATLLATPYVFYYDYVLVLPSLAFWLRHITQNKCKPGEMCLMICVWSVSMWVYFGGSSLHMLPVPQITLLVSLIFLLRRNVYTCGNASLTL